MDNCANWINQARNIQTEINNLTDECQELRECLGLQGIAYDKISVISTPENKLERIMARIDLLERKIKVLKIDKANAVVEIAEELEQMPDSPQKTILYRFYLRQAPMARIAKEMGYDRSYCYKLLKKGRREIYEQATKRENLGSN